MPVSVAIAVPVAIATVATAHTDAKSSARKAGMGQSRLIRRVWDRSCNGAPQPLERRR